jgi:hypothetical protein
VKTELPTGWARVRLDQVAEVRLGRQRSPKNHTGNQMRRYLRAANVDWNGLKLDDVKEMNFTDAEFETFHLVPGDILIGEASGSPHEVGKPALWNGEIKDCCFQNTLLRVRPRSNVDPQFLLLQLRYEALRGAFAEGSRGSGIHHLGAAKLSAWPVILPPLPQQRNIARVLDHVDSLRATRRKAISLLDDLTRSVFLEIFGNPSTNPYGWPERKVNDLLEGSLRNGLSPVTGGTVQAKVLTLSAITGKRFDITAFKVAGFKSHPPREQSVRSSDFLICRGNGNASLVGRGHFPPFDMPDVTFPDTMISLRPSNPIPLT